MSSTPKRTTKPEPHLRSLTEQESSDLNDWLEAHNINPNNLRRSFTDASPLARFLSKMYPNLVDVNFYPPCNSVEAKIRSWQLFNRRVLERLGVAITRVEIELVARSVPGCVDVVLHNIMQRRKEDVANARSASSEDTAKLETQRQSLEDDDISALSAQVEQIPVLPQIEVAPIVRSVPPATKPAKKTKKIKKTTRKTTTTDLPSSTTSATTPQKTKNKVKFTGVKPSQESKSVSGTRRQTKKNFTKTKN